MAYTWPPTIDDVKGELGITSATFDTRLQGYIDAVAGVIDKTYGPITPTTYTETHFGGRLTVSLRHFPVATVSSVVEYVNGAGVTLAAQSLGSVVDGYILLADVGVLQRFRGGAPAYFGYAAFPTPPTATYGAAYPIPATQLSVVVTYTTTATVPAAAWLAHIFAVQALWDTMAQIGRSAGGSPTGESPNTAAPYDRSILPPASLELLEGLRAIPAIA